MITPREYRAAVVEDNAVARQRASGQEAHRYDGWMHGWRLEHSYATLPDLFHAEAAPTPVAAPEIVAFNAPLAAELGLNADVLDSAEGAALFTGNTLPPGARPIAQAYAGHQFGHFTILGDGRAILLGEQIAPDGTRVDVQLKGAGQTRYSRRGDGRAALGPMLRELIVSEAMHALGIPTTRSLAVAATGEPVYRERVLPGAVLTRVAASHLRVGTFQWAAAARDIAALRALADYTRARHFPALDAGADLALFDAIAERQAQLLARWQLVGFVHGVMNTDNMSLAGETIDYGPCAFIDAYDPDAVFSSIDTQGRYALGNQPGIAQWNLARLAEAMLPLFDADTARAIELATASIARFAERFEEHWLTGMRGKLGLFTHEPDDAALAADLLDWMARTRADFTVTFRRLGNDERPSASPDAAFDAWFDRWQARLRRQPQAPDEVRSRMRRHNPAVIARNHKVEEALAAAEHGDVSPLRRLMATLAKPYDDGADSEFVMPPQAPDPAYRTFCGT